MYNTDEEYNALSEEEYFKEMFCNLSANAISDEDFNANQDLFADISDGFCDYNRISGGGLPPAKARKIIEIIISSIRKNGVY